MGQCCGFVKTTNDAGVITHQAQFSREIEEHLDKLEKERIEAQETSSQIGNGVNQGSIIGQYDGKDITLHQSNLSNEIQKQRSVDRNVLKKESLYEDYEVKIVEASPQRDNTLRSYSLAVDKSQFLPADQHRDLERTRSQEKSPSFVAVRKQESLSSRPVVGQEIQLEIQENNQINENTSLLASFKKSNSKDRDEPIIKSSSLKKADTDQIFFPGLQSQTTPINNNNNNNNTSTSPITSPARKDHQKSFHLQTSLPPNQYASSIPSVSTVQSQPQNQSTTGREMADQYQQSGGRKSILTNTLAKKDDPNSGSKSLLTHEDLKEKKKDKKVKLVATPERRFDTDAGAPQDQQEVHTPTKPKGVLKKYDPNASYSDADSPHNKPKKKVKFKESTFKKNSKKKKSKIF